MADIFSKRKRSEIMSKIGPKNSSFEFHIARTLRSLKLSFVRHGKLLPGKPDFVFPKKKKVIFVHGCFWHGHRNCRRSSLPKTNGNFWKKKISSNVKRDMSGCRKLNQRGWSYLVLWQCKIGKLTPVQLSSRINKFLKSGINRNC